MKEWEVSYKTAFPAFVYVEIKCVNKRKQTKTHTLCNTGLLTHYQTHTNSQSALHHVPEL